MIYPIASRELKTAIRALDFALAEESSVESCVYAVLDAVAYERGEFFEGDE